MPRTKHAAPSVKPKAKRQGDATYRIEAPTRDAVREAFNEVYGKYERALEMLAK